MTSIASGHVCAVIVTYNRLDKLKRVLTNVCAQDSAELATIVVVNNASTDGTNAWLETQKVIEPRLKVLQLETNSGGAGGFHRGLLEAYRIGADYAWLMDDDCYPYENALSRLLRAYSGYLERFGEAPGFACSRVLGEDAENICAMNIPGAAWNWCFPYSETLPIIAAHWCSFVSCLVAVSDLDLHGLPLKEYFIWYDDLEFTRRLAQGKCGVVAMNSVAVHDLPCGNPVDWHKVEPSTLWKYRFGLRNEASWTLHNLGFKAYRRFLRRALSPALRSRRLSLRQKLSLVRSGLEAVRFNPQPDFPVSLLGGTKAVSTNGEFLRSFVG
jgi:GT2 family glycosyltransferase